MMTAMNAATKRRKRCFLCFLAFFTLGQYKDWNDALLGKRDQRLIDQGEIDFDYFEFAKAQEAERQQEQAVVLWLMRLILQISSNKLLPILRKGDYQSGTCTAECTYSPEFGENKEGALETVDKYAPYVDLNGDEGKVKGLQELDKTLGGKNADNVADVIELSDMATRHGNVNNAKERGELEQEIRKNNATLSDVDVKRRVDAAVNYYNKVNK